MQLEFGNQTTVMVDFLPNSNPHEGRPEGKPGTPESRVELHPQTVAGIWISYAAEGERKRDAGEILTYQSNTKQQYSITRNHSITLSK